MKKFLTDWRLFTSRGDVLGNFALFVPLGIAGMLHARKRLDTGIGAVLLLIAAFVFSFALQLAQVWLPSRSAALADVVWNMAGMISGMTAMHLAGKRLSGHMRLAGSSVLAPLSILILWMLTELLPLVPSLDWQKFKDALKPLALGFDVSFPAALRHAAGIVVAGSVFMVLTWRPAWWLLAAVLLVLAGKLAIINLTLDASVLMGFLAGYLVFLALLRLGSKNALEAAFWLLFAAWSINAITPFSPASGGTFNGVPFATMLEGSMETNVRALVKSLFTYSALLWLIQKTGVSAMGAAVGLALWSSLLELVQMGLLGRNADVTEPILILLIGWVLSAMRSPARQPPPKPHVEDDDVYVEKQRSGTPASSRQASWIMQGLILLFLAASMWGLLHVPGIPYNLRELFLGGGNFFFLLVFTAALLWVGAGAVWMSRKIVSSRVPLLSVPVWTLVVSLISLALLTASVTQESVDDIAGANNLYWFVVNRDIWGNGWRDFFLLVGPEVIGPFERWGRYAALYSPLLIFLALIAGFFYLHEYGSLTLPRVLLLVASALPWLWLAKAVAFDWSSTDNLNELIARDGPMGWGGGGYLYALTGLLCINAVILGRTLDSFKHLPVVIVGSIAALPLGWWLLNLGLEPKVEKYGFTFSGVQFLLGPDREHLLTDLELFMRWCAVQTGFVVVTALGIRSALLNPYGARKQATADTSQ